MKVGDIVVFKESMFLEPFAPYYNQYRNSKYRIKNILDNEHVELATSGVTDVPYLGFARAFELESYVKVTKERQQGELDRLAEQAYEAMMLAKNFADTNHLAFRINHWDFHLSYHPEDEGEWYSSFC